MWGAYVSASVPLITASWLTFPGRANHWSAIIGGSHSKNYVLWEYGGYASEGVKQVAELGSPVKMEEEIRQQVRTKLENNQNPETPAKASNKFQNWTHQWRWGRNSATGINNHRLTNTQICRQSIPWGFFSRSLKLAVQFCRRTSAGFGALCEVRCGTQTLTVMSPIFPDWIHAFFGLCLTLLLLPCCWNAASLVSWELTQLLMGFLLQFSEVESVTQAV